MDGEKRPTRHNGILETSHCRQSIDCTGMPIDNQTCNNKRTIQKQETQKLIAYKQTGPGSPVRTVHSVRVNVHCGTIGRS